MQVHVNAKDLQARRGLRAPGARLQAVHEGGGLGAVPASFHIYEQVIGWKPICAWFLWKHPGMILLEIVNPHLETQLSLINWTF